MPKKTTTLPTSSDKSKDEETPQPGTPIGLPGDEEENEEGFFEEDFTDIDDDFPMAEEGKHHAKVIDFEKSESKQQNPQYVWEFRITAGNSKDIELRFWTSLLPQARWKAVETLVAVGIPASGSVAKFKKSDLLGKPCIIEVVHDQFEGRTNHKVKRVHSPNKDSVEFAKKDTTPF